MFYTQGKNLSVVAPPAAAGRAAQAKAAGQDAGAEEAAVQEERPEEHAVREPLLAEGYTKDNVLTLSSFSITVNSTSSHSHIRALI